MPPSKKDLQQRIAQRKAIEKKQKEELAKKEAAARKKEKASVKVEESTPEIKKGSIRVPSPIGLFTGEDYRMIGTGAEGIDPHEGEAALKILEEKTEFKGREVPKKPQVYAVDPSTERLENTVTRRFAKDVTIDEVMGYYKNTYGAAAQRQRDVNAQRVKEGLEPFDYGDTVMPTRKEIARDLERYRQSGLPIRTFDEYGRAIPWAGAAVEHAESVATGGKNKGSTGSLEWQPRNAGMGKAQKVEARAKGRTPITAIDMKAKPKGLGLKGLGLFSGFMAPAQIAADAYIANKSNTAYGLNGLLNSVLNSIAPVQMAANMEPVADVNGNIITRGEYIKKYGYDPYGSSGPMG